MKLVLTLFLAAHGLIHVSFLSPAPPRTAGGPEWPFELARSWLVTVLHMEPALVRPVGVGLALTSAGLLLLAGLATAGWLVPTGWWTGLAVAGAATSVVTLLLFFHPWLVLGVLIDVVLLWAIFGAGWRPEGIGT